MRRFILIFIIHASLCWSLSAQVLGDFLSAARSGDAVAQYNAAQCYRHGWGTPPNEVEWRHHLRLAAEGNLPQAIEEFASLVEPHSPELANHLRGSKSDIPYTNTYRSYDDGCYYGELFGGTRDGYGVYIWDDGTCYRGRWEDGARYGVGITHFDDLLVFGNHTGDTHGYGAAIVTAPDHHLASAPGAIRYVGYFEGGIPEGTGTLYDAEGAVSYYGPFVHGVPTDHYPTTDHYSSYRWVREALPNGDVWEGEMVNGSREGFGIYAWSDGSQWFGFWHNGTREGLGLYIRSDGAMITGTWENGELMGMER